MKTKQARKDYTCYACKAVIAKGQRYGTKRITIGKRGDEWVETINGYPTIVQNWISLDVSYCQTCAGDGVSALVTKQVDTETYHYHDVSRTHSEDESVETISGYPCRPECFELTRSEVDANLAHESDEFRDWILGNPSVGDTFIGEGSDMALVQRIPGFDI